MVVKVTLVEQRLDTTRHTVLRFKEDERPESNKTLKLYFARFVTNVGKFSEGFQTIQKVII